MTNTYYGIYQGIVTNIEDPEKRGRIKCKIPKCLGDDHDSAWCDPCVPVSSDFHGDFCVPFINEAVWIIFLEGDVNRPVYLGGWWQKEKTLLGVNYSGLDDLRIINYKDGSIIIHNNDLTITNSSGTIHMADGKIDMTTKGDVNITAGGNFNVTTGGVVNLN